MKTDQLAINAVTTAEAPLDETLRAYADAGFRQVEFVLPRVKKWLAAGRTPADLKALLDSLDMRCIGGFEAAVTVFDEAKREANHALHLANAELLATLGGGVLVVGTDGPAEPSVEALATIGRTLRGLAERIDASVSLAVEFNWSPIVKSLRAAWAVAAAADHPRVGILFDTAHYHCTTTKLADLTDRTVAKVLHVHVNDMRDRPGEMSHCNADRVLPGAGTLDLLEIVGRVEACGYRRAFAVELFNEDLWQLPPAAAARQCYDAMTRLCGDA